MIKNLRFWVQKVLPLVYDDSLSYYELLCKVVDKLNELINVTNVTEENIYTSVKQVLDEWLENGTIGDIINNQILDNIAKTSECGDLVGIEQIFSTNFPYPTSTGARADVVPTNCNAYYYQGFCVTPNGFAMVRLAPESNKAASGDISQIFEFSRTGTYLRSKGVNVHHGNGMVYYDGYLYVDVGSNVAKVKYSDLTIESYINLSGTCPAIDRENKIIYSFSSDYNKLYRYKIESGVIDSIDVSDDCPDIYNGSFYKDGVFYGITYNNDFVMVDVNTGEFLGGKSSPAYDTTGIYLYEFEDCDTDENGNVYVLTQQPHFTSKVYDVNGTEKRLRNVGFHLGKLYLNGGASVSNSVEKPIRIHRSGIYVKSPASLTEAMNATLQTGSSSNPFTSFASLSFLINDVREIHADQYTTMYFGDIYQPVNTGVYGEITNAGFETTYPFVVKGWRGYFLGSDLKLTNYGVTCAFCDIDSLDIDCSNINGSYVGTLYYGNLDIIPHNSGTSKLYMYTQYCKLSGSNVIPIGGANTECIKYSNQTGTEGAEVTLILPVVGGGRGRRFTLSNSTTYEIFRRYNDTKVTGTSGTIITLTEPYDSSTGTLKFIAPFDFSNVEVF